MHESAPAGILLAFAPPATVTSITAYDTSAPDWGWGVGPMTHSSHSISMEFAPGTNAATLRGLIYTRLKEFSDFRENIANLSKTGNLGHFSMNSNIPGDGPNSIDVQFVNDPKNFRVLAVTLGEHPLVGVRIWEVSTSTSADGSVIATVRTEAYERARFVATASFKFPVIGGPFPRASNLIGKPLFGAKLQSDLWERYLRNISMFWFTDGVAGIKAAEWQRTVQAKSADSALTDAQNPFRLLLPADLQQDHPQAPKFQ